MSCVDIMYQPYSTGFPYQRSSSEAVQAFNVPRMHEPLDLGSYSTSASAPSAVKEEELDKDLQPKETHYLAANCVLLTYFTGDTSSVVDEHFSRALSQPSSFSSETQGSKSLACKDGPLMSQRNFPASFWNSAYQPTPTPTLGHPDFQFSSNPYFPSLHGISSLHQDPWHYPLSSQTSSYPHRGMHYDLSYPSMASTSRFSPNYGSLLMNPSMRTSQFGSMGQCDLSKGSDPTRPRYPDPRLGTEFSTHSGLPGLEGSLQEAGKDLYWF